MAENGLDAQTASTIGQLVAQVAWIVDTLKEMKQEISSGKLVSIDKFESLVDKAEALEKRVEALETADDKKAAKRIAVIGAVFGGVGCLTAIASVFIMAFKH